MTMQKDLENCAQLAMFLKTTFQNCSFGQLKIDTCRMSLERILIFIKENSLEYSNLERQQEGQGVTLDAIIIDKGF